MNKILVLGHSGHGKDTFAKIYSKYTGAKFESSSFSAFEAIKPVLKKIFPDQNDQELYRRRRVNRELWRELILLYNTPDRSALARKILETNDIYVGMRSIEEFEASKHMFNKIYYVMAFDRKGIDESMQIEFDKYSMLEVDNNGDKKQLRNSWSWVLGGVK